MAATLAWGILGTGNIAKTFARGLASASTGRLVAVGSRGQEGADSFGAEFGVDRRHGSYEALLADPEVQAVYVATPHPMHAEWAIKTAEAGKHVLCEKPLALNHPQAMAVVEAARRCGVYCMEAFMYRCHPQTARLVELIREGAIGEVRLVQATFSFQSSFDSEARLFNPELGGGAIMDVGCYTASMARLVAGAARGEPFADPVEVKATAHIGESGVDEWSVATLEFPGGVLAQLSTGVRLNQESAVRVYGSEGHIHVPEPWVPPSEGGTATFVVHRRGAEPEEHTTQTDLPLYSLEADTFAEGLESGQAPYPAMTPEDTLGNMRTLDQWRESIGLTYPAERPERQTAPVHGRQLAARPDSNMKYGEIPGLEKRVSRLVMGADNQATTAHASVMFDDYFERGGNTFDTAWIYGGGRQERLLGEWVRSRGVRDQVVILAKGAHTPYNTPADMRRQFEQSLERLGMEYVDLYALHRDNPQIPAGEFIDVLNEQVQAGRIKAFGGSNWAISRIREANEYAETKGLAGFSFVSNNFSLARMVNPVWAGCIAASDPESRAWLTETQMALMPWSSQARGFFTERASPEKLEDEELVHSWYSEDNWERKARVNQMAKERGVLPIQVALAYVLSQPFPTFPLIGPRALSETATSFPALDIELTPEEVRWLNLEA